MAYGLELSLEIRYAIVAMSLANHDDVALLHLDE